MTRQEIIEYVRPLVAAHFKHRDGKPIILTDSQCVLFDYIFRKWTPRVHVECFTRFGKSLTVALAILMRICTFAEKWFIAAGNDKQAGIIMSYIIEHIFDNDFTRKKFVIEKGESEETIRRYKNKNRLNFKVDRDASGQLLLGEVFITNAKGALGFGAANGVGDESAMTSDEDEALIARMLGDSTENFYMKIGNPWDSGHFDKSRDDEKYVKFIVDYKQGIAEGRFTIDQAFEMQKKPFWGVLYACKRPPAGSMDDEGWIPLLTKDEVDARIIRVPDVMAKECEGFGVSKLGGDVAGGGKNFSTAVQRFTNAARLILKSSDPDTMSYAEKIMTLRTQLRLNPWDISIDHVGVGTGAYDILARQTDMGGIHGINAGDKLPDGSQDAELFFNLRAAMYWRLRTWILGGGKLYALEGEDLEDSWYQLTKIYYRKRLEGMHGKLQIMPKETMLKRGIPSPDVADALSLTFATEDVVRGGDGTGIVAPQSDAPFDKFGVVPY